MASHFEEEPFSLGEKSERMVTVTPFMGKLKVHIRQFYIDGNGEIKLGMSGIVLEIEEFYNLSELIPQIKRSIESCELKDTVIPSSPFQLDLLVLDLDTVFLPSPPSQEPIPFTLDEELFGTQPKFPSLLPSPALPYASSLMEPSLEKYLSDLSPKEKLEIYYQDLATDEYLFGPSINEEAVVFESENPVSLPSLENVDDNSPKEQKEKRKRSKELPEVPRRS